MHFSTNEDGGENRGRKKLKKSADEKSSKKSKLFGF
jgi:hypothetical protein